MRISGRLLLCTLTIVIVALLPNGADATSQCWGAAEPEDAYDFYNPAQFPSCAQDTTQFKSCQSSICTCLSLDEGCEGDVPSTVACADLTACAATFVRCVNAAYIDIIEQNIFSNDSALFNDSALCGNDSRVTAFQEFAIAYETEQDRPAFVNSSNAIAQACVHQFCMLANQTGNICQRQENAGDDADASSFDLAAVCVPPTLSETNEPTGTQLMPTTAGGTPSKMPMPTTAGGTPSKMPTFVPRGTPTPTKLKPGGTPDVPYTIVRLTLTFNVDFSSSMVSAEKRNELKRSLEDAISSKLGYTFRILSVTFVNADLVATTFAKKGASSSRKFSAQNTPNSLTVVADANVPNSEAGTLATLTEKANDLKTDTSTEWLSGVANACGCTVPPPTVSVAFLAGATTAPSVPGATTAPSVPSAIQAACNARCIGGLIGGSLAVIIIFTGLGIIFARRSAAQMEAAAAGGKALTNDPNNPLEHIKNDLHNEPYSQDPQAMTNRV